MFHPFFHKLQPTLHIAHRGGSALAPENTMQAFELAVNGFRTDMLEIDVHLSSDGHLVVIHDATLDRTTDGTGKVSDRTWEELMLLDAGYHFQRDGHHPFRDKGIRIPRLDHVLTAFPDMLFNIEVKDGGASVEDRFADVLRKTQAISRVCVGSEDDMLSKRLLRALPEACHFFSQGEGTRRIMELKTGTESSKTDAYHVLDIPLYHHGMRVVDEELLLRATRAGLWVNVWTVDDVSEMERLIQEGVGGIMTDRPDVLRRILDEQSRRLET